MTRSLRHQTGQVMVFISKWGTAMIVIVVLAFLFRHHVTRVVVQEVPNTLATGGKVAGSISSHSGAAA